MKKTEKRWGLVSTAGKSGPFLTQELFPLKLDARDAKDGRSYLHIVPVTLTYEVPEVPDA